MGGALGINPERAVHVRVPNAPSLNPAAQLSVAAWILPERWVGGRRRVLQKGYLDDQFRLWSEDSTLRFAVTGPSSMNASAPLPSTGAWHHVVGVYDGTVLQLYVDGVAGTSVAASGASRASTDDLVIGTKSPTGIAGDFFAGRVDEVLFYARALTPAEITQLAAGGSPP
jgi:beta-galactosidase